MGIDEPRRVYTSADLASGRRIIFAATGVTEGALMKGVRFFGEGCRTSSVVMQTQPHRVQFIDTIHVKQQAGPARIALLSHFASRGVFRLAVLPAAERASDLVFVGAAPSGVEGGARTRGFCGLEGARGD